MDLGAYLNIDKLAKYVKDVCGEMPPRLRGLRLMKVESSDDFDDIDFTYDNMMLYSEMCGQDYIYLHTRCGGANYVDFGMDVWEEKHDAFGADDCFDRTYRDTYVKAVDNETYRKLIADMEKSS